MSLLPVWIVLLSYALVKGCAEALQCYTCENCTAVNESLLQLCPSNNATVAVALPSTIRMEEVSTTSVPETTAAQPDEADEATEAAADDATESEEPAVPDEAQPAEAEAVEGTDPQPELEALVLSPTDMTHLNITRRKRDEPSVRLTYYCFTVQRNETGRTRNEKGCIGVPDKGDACSTLSAGKNCRVCSRDKCNSAAISNYSLAAALLVIVNTLVQW